MTRRPPPPMLTDATARRIKALLWAGQTAESISATLSSESARVSRDTIKAIAAGVRWASVEWPDGSKGKLPAARRAKITAARSQLLKQSGATLKKLLDGPGGPDA